RRLRLLDDRRRFGIVLEQLGHDVRDGGTMATDEGGRTADIDRGDTNAGREQAVDNSLAKAGRQPSSEPVAEQLRQQAVPRRHAASDRKMRRNLTGETQEAEEAGPAAVEHGQPADYAEVLEQHNHEVDQRAG